MGAHDDDYAMHNTAIIVILTILSILTTLTSLALLVVILIKSDLRKCPTSWLVINVLVSVILTGLVYLPMLAYNTPGFRSGMAGCQILFLIDNFKTVHVQFSMLLLFIDRFIWFIKPNDYSQIMTPKVIKICIIFFVIFDLVLGIVVKFTFQETAVRANDGNLVLCSEYIHMFTYIIWHILNTLPMALNVIFGIITMLSALVVCYRGQSGSDKDVSSGRQAMGLILLMILLDLGLHLPLWLNFIVRFQEGSRNTLRCVESLFFLVVSFPMMFLIPEIRSTITPYCKAEKKGEEVPLNTPP